MSLKMGYTSTSKCPSTEKEHDEIYHQNLRHPIFRRTHGFPLQSLINYWTNPALHFSLMWKLRVFLQCSILISDLPQTDCRSVLQRLRTCTHVTRNGYPAVIKHCNGQFPGWWFGTFFIFPYIGNNHPN